jgi:hypothetical protein
MLKVSIEMINDGYFKSNLANCNHIKKFASTRNRRKEINWAQFQVLGIDH